MKNYVELVKKSQEKNESPSPVKPESILTTPSGAYMLLPNQKYVKILVGPQNQGANTFQNVFLNLIPATSLTSVASPSTPVDGKTTTTTKSKDTNQNVFLNLNNTFQKFIPVASSPVTPTVSATLPAAVEVTKKIIPTPIKSPPPLSIPSQNVNVNQLLTESKSEEVSVEIDPTVFGLEGDEDGESNDEEEINDYDEVISSAKITLKDFKPNGEKIEKIPNGKDDAKFVPILPKQQQDDFLTSGQHFLFGPSGNNTDFVCESCQKSFTSKRFLKVHFNQFHLGKMPFKCEFCYLEYATRTEYENCKKNHNLDSDALNKNLTLEDFANHSQSSDISLLEDEANLTASENGEYFCDVCHRPFNSSTGLLRHKVRKHNQKNRKKYFIKGMKNARCDICNREFSTQSYMQLHRKLHLRDDIGYKYKVFGKSKYGDVEHLIKDEKDEKTEKTKSKTDAKNKEFKSEPSSSPEHEENNKEFVSKTDECDIMEPEIKMEVEEQSDNENNDNEDDEDDDDEDSNIDEPKEDEKTDEIHDGDAKQSEMN